MPRDIIDCNRRITPGAAQAAVEQTRPVAAQAAIDQTSLSTAKAAIEQTHLERQHRLL
jgi:hypothetical protein